MLMLTAVTAAERSTEENERQREQPGRKGKKTEEGAWSSGRFRKVSGTAGDADGAKYRRRCARNLRRVPPNQHLRSLTNTRTSDLPSGRQSLIDSKSTYCFGAHMHEMMKYFLLTENH